MLCCHKYTYTINTSMTADKCKQDKVSEEVQHRLSAKIKYVKAASDLKAKAV